MQRLKGAAPEKVRTRRMDYMTIPLSTDATFDGFPVCALMVPQAGAGGLENEAVFDTWCSVICEEGGGLNDAVRAIRELGRSDLADFLLANSTDIESASVMLLFALGRETGAALEFDRDGMTVTHDSARFGAINGVAFSRFSTGFNLGAIDPVGTLGSVKQVRTFDTAFIAMYREAYALGDDSLAALIALRCGDTRFNFSKEFAKHRKRCIPGSKMLCDVERLLMGAKDPITRVYKKLVPKWMSSTEFERSICRLSLRNLDPPWGLRLKYISNMHEFFHKNKNNRTQHEQAAKQHTT